MTSSAQRLPFLLLLATVPSVLPLPSQAQEVAKPDVSEPSAAQGLVAGSVLVRARVSGTKAINQHSSIDVIGGRYDSPSMILPDVDVTYFIDDHVAISGQAGVVRTKPSIKDGSYMGFPIGDIPIGEIWTAGGLATLQYHFGAIGGFRPYLGAGFAASFPISTEPAGGFVRDFEVESIAGLALQIGADYHVGGNWYANAELKQILLPTYTFKGGGVTARIDMDTLTVGTGIGYRF